MSFESDDEIEYVILKGNHEDMFVGITFGIVH